MDNKTTLHHPNKYQYSFSLQIQFLNVSLISFLHILEGEEVAAGQPIAIIEAMKMETNIISAVDGTIDKIYVKQGDQVVSGQLVAKLQEAEVDEGEKNVTL